MTYKELIHMGTYSLTLPDNSILHCIYMRISYDHILITKYGDYKLDVDNRLFLPTKPKTVPNSLPCDTFSTYTHDKNDTSSIIANRFSFGGQLTLFTIVLYLSFLVP